MLPSASNPLVLNIVGHVPSLKNNKLQVTRANGTTAFVPNSEVIGFYKRVSSYCQKQIERQGFDRITFPNPVAVYGEFWFYVANETNISASDADNALTTILDMLQKPRKREPYLWVMDDDKQVLSPKGDAYAVRDRKKEGARVFVWVLDERISRWDNWDIFKGFYLNNRPATGHTHQNSINIDEVLDLLT